MKKLRQAGKLGAGRTVVVNGIGGLGSYGVQYARLLGGGATVVAFARSDEKLALAMENGAHHTVNTRGKTAEEVQDALEDLTGRRDADAILDCAGAEDGLALGAAVLAREGALTCVGLMGQKVVLPLLPFTNGEKSYFGSFWGNYDDLGEVLALASQGLIKHTVVPVVLDDINEKLEALARGTSSVAPSLRSYHPAPTSRARYPQPGIDRQALVCELRADRFWRSVSLALWYGRIRHRIGSARAVSCPAESGRCCLHEMRELSSDEVGSLFRVELAERLETQERTNRGLMYRVFGQIADPPDEVGLVSGLIDSLWARVRIRAMRSSGA